jgi:hypothetical protein
MLADLSTFLFPDKAWFSSLSLSPDTPRIDTLVLESFQRKWNALLETKRNR